jgi:hypothetical protein
MHGLAALSILLAGEIVLTAALAAASGSSGESVEPLFEKDDRQKQTGERHAWNTTRSSGGGQSSASATVITLTALSTQNHVFYDGGPFYEEVLFEETFTKGIGPFTTARLSVCSVRSEPCPDPSGCRPPPP